MKEKWNEEIETVQHWNMIVKNLNLKSIFLCQSSHRGLSKVSICFFELKLMHLT
jgi:hypothetical protein